MPNGAERAFPGRIARRIVEKRAWSGSSQGTAVSGLSGGRPGYPPPKAPPAAASISHPHLSGPAHSPSYDELAALDQWAAAGPPNWCNPEGFWPLISFHSLEDRRPSKTAFLGDGRRGAGCTRKPLVASAAETGGQSPAALGQSCVWRRRCRESTFPCRSFSRSDLLWWAALLIQPAGIPGTLLPGFCPEAISFLPLGRALGLGCGLGHRLAQRSLRQLDPAAGLGGRCPRGGAGGGRACRPPAGPQVRPLGLGVAVVWLPAGPAVGGRCWEPWWGRWRASLGELISAPAPWGPSTARLRRSLLVGWPVVAGMLGQPVGRRPCWAVLGVVVSCCSALVLLPGPEPEFCLRIGAASEVVSCQGVAATTPKGEERQARHFLVAGDQNRHVEASACFQAPTGCKWPWRAGVAPIRQPTGKAPHPAADQERASPAFAAASAR